MKIEEILSQLSDHPLFAGVSQETLSEKLTDDAVVEFSPGQEIYSPKSREKRLGIILSGSASVFSADEACGVLLRVLESGDTFGVANLFSRQERFVSYIVAKKHCRVLFFSEASTAALLKDEPCFCLNYVRFLSDRICFLNDKISCFTAGSPERRLAFFLLALDESEQITYTVSTNANSLSDMLNVGRASLYRAFDKLEAEGLIRKNGKEITVTDKNALKRRFG